MRHEIEIPLRALRYFDVETMRLGYVPGPKSPEPTPDEPPTRPDEKTPPDRPYETPAVPGRPELPLPSDPPEEPPTLG